MYICIHICFLMCFEFIADIYHLRAASNQCNYPLALEILCKFTDYASQLLLLNTVIEATCTDPLL